MFGPKKGAEIQKVRPAAVISVKGVGRLPLRIVVPITDWKKEYADYPWFVHLRVTPTNGLTKESGADAFQVKSVSVERFMTKLGVLHDGEMESIAAAISLCVGYQ